jgi:hypothetical protein
MVGGVGISNSESDGNPIEETNARLGAAFTDEIISDEKDEFVMAFFQLLSGKERLICAAVGVGANGLQQLQLLLVRIPQFDLHVLSGTAVGRIENVSA